MARRTTRRDFLKQSTAAGVGFWVAAGLTPSVSRSANEQLSFACIGVGGKGSSDTDQAGNFGNVVALCDIDDNTLNGKAKRFPKAKLYHDFRKLFDEMGKSIDAVTVSTPDHTHAHSSIMAMRMGKHVYCEKPLTHSVWEARQLRELAAKHKVATQMGNQGTSSGGLRTAVEIIRSGAIGEVREIHLWTNRPIWPQGQAALDARMKGNATVPNTLSWDLWLGPCSDRAYNSSYLPFSWRGWWDFGTGALGDMGCHTMNLPFMALRLGAPSAISADVEGNKVDRDACPVGCTVTYEFPSRGEGMPACRLFWYERRRPAAEITAGIQNVG